MDKTLLKKPFEKSDSPGLSPIDPRFTDISSLIQDGNYADAALQAESVINEAIYDVRIICYFLYGLLLEHGAGALVDIVESLAMMLGDNWEATGPVKNKEKQAKNSINWLLKQLVKKLQNEEQKKTPDWQAWQGEVDSDQIQEVLDHCDTLQKVMGTALEDAVSQLFDVLSKFKDWLKSFQKLVYKEPEPEPEPEPEVAEEPEEEQKGAGVTVTIDQSSYVGESYHLSLLLKKLSVFETLIQRGEIQKAALVAFDINAVISEFDPKLYFPKMFAQFSLQCARHAGALISVEDSRGTVEWQALEELYKVDIDSFVSFESEMSFSTPAQGDQDSGVQDQETDEYPDENKDDDW